MQITPVSLSQPPYLLLQFHHLGLSIVQGLVSDLNVSSLVFIGGACSSQFYFQFLLFPLCFFVYRKEVRVTNRRHSSLLNFQEFFTSEVKERWGNFSQDTEHKSIA